MTASLTIDRLLHGTGEVGAAEPSRRVDDPHRELMAGAALAALLVIGCGGWALTTQLDAAVSGPGVIRLADERRQVQAPASGIVAAVRIANGQAVHAGQVLVEFAASEAVAQAQSLSARVFALQAEIARIEAEQRGAARIAPPEAFAALAGADRQAAADALAGEQAQLDVERELEAAKVALLHDRATQVRQQIAGQGDRLQSEQRQKSANQEELAAYQQLLAKGLATKPRILALQREAAGIDGDAGATRAEVARLHSQVGEAQLQLAQLRSERAQQNADRLHAARTELATLIPQWTAARDELSRTTIRAPFDGTVNAAQMPSAGTVVQPGTRLLEIVPKKGSLTVDMRVPIAEAAELRRGQQAQVRLAGAGGRLLPTLKGTIDRVSADSLDDERTGQSFYTASIRIAPAEIAHAATLGGLAGGVRPGMPVEVVVPTHARSAFGYMVGPLLSRTGGLFAQR